MSDHFEGEDVIITFERNGGATVTNVEGKCTSIKVSGGEENQEVRYAFGNKSILFGKPKEKFKVEMDVMLSNNSASRVFLQAQLGGSSAVAGTTLKSSSSPDYWRIIVWFVPFGEQISSGSTFLPPKTSDNLGRMIFCDCKAVSFDKEFDSEDMLIGTLSFELAATDESGYANHFVGFTNATTSALTPMEITTTYAAEYRGVLEWSTTAKTWTGAYST